MQGVNLWPFVELLTLILAAPRRQGVRMDLLEAATSLRWLLLTFKYHFSVLWSVLSFVAYMSYYNFVIFLLFAISQAF